jgi:hypothetical protein
MIKCPDCGSNNIFRFCSIWFEDGYQQTAILEPDITCCKNCYQEVEV